MSPTQVKLTCCIRAEIRVVVVHVGVVVVVVVNVGVGEVVDVWRGRRCGSRDCLTWGKWGVGGFGF